jgi:predicted nucleic acid-binding protein
VDTSVWINLHNGSLLLQALSLTNKGWRFYVTQLVARELRDPSGEILEQWGVKRYSLSNKEIREIETLRKQKPALSSADASVIVAAKALGVSILTDERLLREKAKELGINVHGTLWLLDQMIKNQLIDNDVLCDALDKMIDAGARFPEDEVKRLKTHYNCPE